MAANPKLSFKLSPQALENRVDPPCPYFGSCGGCQLQHVSYPRQLIEKENWLRDLMGDLTDLGKIRPVQPSPKEWNYRRRIQLQVGPRGEVGFFEKGTQKVVPVENCLIAEERLNQAIPEVLSLAAHALRNKARPTLLSFELTVKVGENVTIKQGRAERFFLQTNPGANEQLKNYLLKKFSQKKPRSVLELFSGDGNLTGLLAGRTDSWVAIEYQNEALLKAQEKLKDISPPIRWIQGEAGRELRKLLRTQDNYDWVLLDPPREGAPQCMESLIKLKPQTLIYVSCSPLSLRADLKRLIPQAYEIEEIQPFDFFPHTTHLETVVILKSSS